MDPFRSMQAVPLDGAVESALHEVGDKADRYRGRWLMFGGLSGCVAGLGGAAAWFASHGGYGGWPAGLVMFLAGGIGAGVWAGTALGKRGVRRHMEKWCADAARRFEVDPQVVAQIMQQCMATGLGSLGRKERKELLRRAEAVLLDLHKDQLLALPGQAEPQPKIEEAQAVLDAAKQAELAALPQAEPLEPEDPETRRRLAAASAKPVRR